MKSTKTIMSSNRFFIKHKTISDIQYAPYTPLDFSEIDQRAKKLARIIEDKFEDLTNILLEYESYEVVKDETERSLDLLKSLEENKKYFYLRVGAITTFLPRNQPLYAFCCFVVVPSLMASEVHFCIPHAMLNFFGKMLLLLDIPKNFPNIIVSSQHRLEFLKDRTALLENPKTKETKPLNDIVIFTGNSSNADKLRSVFDMRTLFIANGAGHNPVVVSKDADLSKAAKAVLTLQFYNQGQDCAAPNAILVHKNVLQEFLYILRNSIKDITVGHYRDKLCQIGPISDPKDLVRIQDLLIENREWLDPSTPGIIRTHDAIVEPTIICKPLKLGGNFKEIFTPIIFIQEYTNDADLKSYFEDLEYARNAMYVTLYGTSNYIKNLIDKKINGKILHGKDTLLCNTHLHALGVERGTQPYGGYGYGASNISIKGKIIAKPTLPQRDIYEYMVKPLIRKKSIGSYKSLCLQFTKIQKRDVEKLLKLHSLKSDKQHQELGSDNAYLDLRLIQKNNARYFKIPEENLHYLLPEPNVDYIGKLKAEDIKLIRALRTLINRKSKISLDKFRILLYNIPKEPNANETRNKELQHHFFMHVYQLLFGKNHGPQLTPFLWDANNKKINYLLKNV